MYQYVFRYLSALTLIAVLCEVLSCNNWGKTAKYIAVPKSCIVLFETNDWGNLQNILKETYSGNTVSELVFVKKVIADYKELSRLLSTDASVEKSLQAESTLLSVHLTSATEFGVLLNARLDGINDNLLINHLQNLSGVKSVKVRVFKKQKIIDIQLLDGRIVTLAILKKNLCAGFHSFLVENSVSAILNGESVASMNAFKSCVNNKSNSSALVAFANFQKLNALFPLLFNRDAQNHLYDFAQMGEWGVFDLQFTHNEIKFGGYSPMVSSLPSLNYGLMKQIPENAAVATLCTDSTFLLNKISSPYFTGWASQPVALVNLHSLNTDYQKQNVYMIPCANSKMAKADLLQWLSAANLPTMPCDSTSGYEIFEIGDLSLLNTLFENKFYSFPSAYFCILEHVVVFTAKKETLDHIIGKINNGEVLAKQPHTRALSQCVDCKNCAVTYINFENAEGVFRQIFPSASSFFNFANNVEFVLMGSQTIDNATTYDGVVKLGTKTEKKGPKVLWQTRLKVPAISNPTIATKSDGSKIIFVQDSLLHLYALNASGEILFTKPIEEKIWSSVHTVDYYGNGTDEQFLFTTTNKVYLVNSTGDDFANYPIRLSAPTSSNIAVSGNKQKYFVSCANGNLYGFEISGKPLPGFSPKSGVGELLQPIEIVKHQNKEWIVANNTSGKLILISNNGDTKWNADHTYNFYAIQKSGTFQLLSAKENQLTMIDALGNDKIILLKDTARFFAASIIDDTSTTLYIGNQNYVKLYDANLKFIGAVGTGAGNINSMHLLKQISVQKIVIGYDNKYMLCDGDLKSSVIFESQKFTITTLLGNSNTCLIEATENGMLICRTLK